MQGLASASCRCAEHVICSRFGQGACSQHLQPGLAEAATGRNDGSSGGKVSFRARAPQHPVVGTAPASAGLAPWTASPAYLGQCCNLGRQTNDLCSQNVFFRAVAVSHHRFKLAAVAGRSTECSCARAFLELACASPARPTHIKPQQRGSKVILVRNHRLGRPFAREPNLMTWAMTNTPNNHAEP